MAVGLFCLMFAGMMFFAGSAAVIVLFCSRGGRRALTMGALVVLAAFVAVGVLRLHGAASHAIAQRAAAEAEQRALAEHVRAEIETRLGGDALGKMAAQRLETVTIEIRWHADKLKGLASSPTAIADAVSSILVALDEMTSDESELAKASLSKNLLDAQVSIEEGHKVRLGDVAQVVARRRIGVAESSEGTIHVRLEGVDPHRIAILLDQATTLVERAIASADDPLRSLATIDRDGDARGFLIRFPARKAREVASRLVLPAHLDAPTTKAATTPETEAAQNPTEIRPVAADGAAKPEAEPAELATPPVPPVAQAEPASSDTTPEHRARPAWVGKAEQRQPNGIYRMTAKAGPYSSTEECFAEAPNLVRGIVMSYADRLFGQKAAYEMQVPGSWIESVLVKDQWIGEIESETLGTTMYEMHVLVEFDDAARSELAGMWQKAQLDRRLAMTGAASGAVLLLLGTTFGYLKLDTATRGFYSGRLKIAAGAIVAGGGLLLVQMLRMV